MKDILEKARTTSLSYDVRCEKDKQQGVLELKHCSLRKFHTFLDLHIKNGLNLVPIVAVDFSLANLTFDENQYCIHTLKQGASNDYIIALKRIGKCFQYFSKFMLGYGFGARTV